MANYLVALVLTLLIETAVAFAYDRKSGKLLRSVVLVNLVSHPLFGYFLWISPTLGLPRSTGLIWICEGVIVLLEAGLLIFSVPERSKTVLLTLSLTMNATSFLVGGAIVRYLPI